MTMNPWRPWNGRDAAPRDLHYATPVDVRLRCGAEDRGRCPVSSFAWQHTGGPNDIVAYRPCPALHEAPAGLRRAL